MSEVPLGTGLRVGIDTGGTFTDFVVFDPAGGLLESFKIPSTPDDPARAVLEGLGRISLASAVSALVHGSTVATNALLERKGARTALVTTVGFRDVLAIGRQDRPGLYDLAPSLPETLIPDELRFEVEERVDHTGRALRPLDLAALPPLLARLENAGVESVAICLLFSFTNPTHEKQLAEALRRTSMRVSVSHEILPEYREFERTATTAVNAYVSPVMDRYLGNLEDALGPTSLRIMQSNGGVISPREARRNAVRCILSGPAGGIIAARALSGLSQEAGEQVRALTFDMGGTSTDVALIDGEPELTTQGQIAGLPIGIPLLDIHTIGAGGGSIAHIDPGGNLRVGPQSAGAIPGPACYGRAQQDRTPAATVTDANLLLGRIQPDHFLGGEMPLFRELAENAVRPLSQALGLTLEETAVGILRVSEAHMARALRVISVERGRDPHDFALVSFGGAGGLHAASLAREMGIRRLLVPRHAATFSALGMLLADVVKDYARTLMLPGNAEYGRLEKLFTPLEEQGRDDLAAEGIPAHAVEISRHLEVRYRGQSYELRVPFEPDWPDRFLQAQEEMYGYVPPGGEIEIVNIRVQARAAVARPVFQAQPFRGADPGAAHVGKRPVWLAEGFQPVDFYDFGALRAGNRIHGPAVILRSDTTILVPQGDRAEVDPYRNIEIQVDI